VLTEPGKGHKETSNSLICSKAYVLHICIHRGAVIFQTVYTWVLLP
jgi:hypothetical protein